MSGPSQNPLKRIIGEIHRRSLWQVLAIYVAASWAVLEAADVLIERLALPDWIYGFAVILLLIGLPVVLATAFVQEGARDSRRKRGLPDEAVAGRVTGESGRRSEPDTGGVRGLFTWRNAIVGGILVFAVWGVVAAGWVVVGPGGGATGSGEAPGDEERASIAVLPFDNLSPDPEADAYFVDGMHDEILTHLSKIGALKVISRTSVLEYRDSPKNIRTIAGELGVRNVLEGTVRRAGDRVRITAQLIDAETDEHLWAESYDRELADIFAIQTAVAREIAGALGPALGEGELAAGLAAKPTENLEAYDFYLRGLDYERRPGNQARDMDAAVRMLEQAVALDPGFALAHARLGLIHSRIYNLMTLDRSEVRRDQAKEAVDRALALAPDLPEAHKALGYFRYAFHRDYEGALEAYALAQRGLPGDAELLAFQGYAHRRAGNWGRARRALERAAELNPRKGDILEQLGQLYGSLREYELARETYERALTLAPDHQNVRHLLAHLAMWGEGDPEPLRRNVSERCSESCERRGTWAIDRWLIALADQDYEAAIEVVSDPALEAVDIGGLGPKPLLRAMAYHLAGDAERALPAFDSARVILEELVADRPDDPGMHAALGFAYAGLGRKDAAVRAGRRATELMPIERDAFFGPGPVLDLAWIYAMVGQPDAAIDQLERYLSVPAPWSVRGLAAHPFARPLRDHPRFQALLEEYEQARR